MTNEVAKKIIRGITDKIECNTVDIDDWAEFWGFTREEYEEFFDMAIKALEQQPCEECISREAVNVLVDELARAISDERCCISRGRSTATIMRDILHLPSVTPKGVTVTDFADKCRECGKIQNELAEDAVSREEVLNALDRVGNLKMYKNCDLFAEHYAEYVRALPSVKPKYTDEEIDKAQAVEQAYVDKMVELAVEEAKRPKGKWIVFRCGDTDTFKCSKCGMRVINPYKYCPNCGSYNEGVKDET